MAQQMVSQKIEKICDGCGRTETYELVGTSPQQIAELQEWRIIYRELFIEGNWTKVVYLACSRACLVPSDEKVESAITKPEPSDDIDLSTLRKTDLN